MIEETDLGHLGCWWMWDVDEKLLSISTVVCHQVVIFSLIEVIGC